MWAYYLLLQLFSLIFFLKTILIFFTWKGQILVNVNDVVCFHWATKNLDLALCVDAPTPPTKSTTTQKTSYEKW